MDVTAEAAAEVGPGIPVAPAGVAVGAGAGVAPELPAATERDEAGEPRIFVASQRQLIWWKFRKHKPAVVSTVVVALAYLVALFVEPLAPFTTDYTSTVSQYAPPQRVHFFDRGQFVGPYV